MSTFIVCLAILCAIGWYLVKHRKKRYITTKSVYDEGWEPMPFRDWVALREGRSFRTDHI